MNEEATAVTRETYRLLEDFMLRHMDPKDCAHGPEHIYRVLHNALDIASHEENVDTDVLIAACLLHDVGRKAQLENPALDHAQVGAEMAREFLIERSFSGEYADRVADCIRAHRYRKENPFNSIEAKILFDADKLDAAGLMGIARTLSYNGLIDRPLYTRTEDGDVSESLDGPASFVREYNYKLKNVYARFNTARATEIACERRSAAIRFYKNLLNEIRSSDHAGKALLEKALSE